MGTADIEELVTALARLHDTAQAIVGNCYTAHRSAVAILRSWRDMPFPTLALNCALFSYHADTTGTLTASRQDFLDEFGPEDHRGVSGSAASAILQARPDQAPIEIGKLTAGSAHHLIARLSYVLPMRSDVFTEEMVFDKTEQTLPEIVECVAKFVERMAILGIGPPAFNQALPVEWRQLAVRFFLRREERDKLSSADEWQPPESVERASTPWCVTLQTRIRSEFEAAVGLAEQEWATSKHQRLTGEEKSSTPLRPVRGAKNAHVWVVGAAAAVREAGVATPMKKAAAKHLTRMARGKAGLRPGIEFRGSGRVREYNVARCKQHLRDYLPAGE